MQLNLVSARGSNLAGPHGFGPPLALVTGLSGCIQEFGHRPPGTAVAGGVGFAAEPAPQLHLDLGSVALGNPVEEGVLLAGRQVLDPPGQLAGIDFRLGQGRAGLGCDREQAGVEAEEVGQGALWRSEDSQAGGHRWLQFVLFVAVEGVPVAFPGSVGRQPGQIQGTQVPAASSARTPTIADRESSAPSTQSPLSSSLIRSRMRCSPRVQAAT